MKKPVSMTRALLEKEWFTFVIWHTKTFVEAADHIGLDPSTLRDHRNLYHIAAPPQDHYQGPELSPREMFDAFCVHLGLAVEAGAVLTDATALAHFVEVKPTGPAITIPLTALLALINPTPATGNPGPPPSSPPT